MRHNHNNILLSVIMPALNEEKNIATAVSNARKAFKDFNIEGEIIVVNDGSSDNTENIVESIMQKDKHVRLLRHDAAKGIGASFWEGVDNAKGNIIVMLPGDNENDPWEIFRYYRLLEHVDIVIPFVYNERVRSLFRNILSYLYRFIINTTFMVNFNYTNGTILFRKSMLKELDYRSNSFFFQTDILIRTVKKGYLFAEVPYKIDLRKDGISKAVTFPSLMKVVRGYLRLVRDHYFRHDNKDNISFTQDSLTVVRRHEDNSRVMSTLILDGHKLLWHKESIEAWLRGERIAPITIDCALTRGCTYRCLYCYGQLQANDEKRMTKEVIFRFLDDAAEIGVKAISFVSDGESTCSPHLYDAILRGKANGLDMALGTNGYLLRDDMLEDMLPCLTYLRFNISAAEPERYSQIMGCKEDWFYKVYETIKKCINIKRENNLSVTLGLQMVLLPEFSDQIIPLSKFGKELGVDYTVIKHCSDDEMGSLGVDYTKYQNMVDLLKTAEAYSDDNYIVRAKWSKILSGGKRCYSRCYGPPFIMQFSGSGLVAPCGMLFNDRYNKYHIGNIADTSFKKLWQGERYWEVINLIASDRFDARTMCGSLCLQHKVNEFLWDVKNNGAVPKEAEGEPPMHINFI